MIPRFFLKGLAESLKYKRQRNGFTLIEIIIYVALASIVLVAVLQSMLLVVGTREQTRGQTDLHYAVRYGLERMRRTAWNAQGVNVAASRFQTNSGVLSLLMSGASLNPTVFSLSGSRVYAREASGTALPLTPPSVRVDQLLFTKLTATGAHATIQILLQATDITKNVPKPAQVLMRSSVTLRQ